MDEFEPPALDVHAEHEAWQRTTIRRYGWALQAVLADDESPPFIYTVGLTGLGHPELILFATSQATGAAVLNELGELVRAGGRLRPGDQVTLRQGRVHLLDLPRSDGWLFGANDLYRRAGESPIPALLVVPDAELVEVDGPDRGCCWCG
ncbi:MAG: DUF4262 domain-containing protein [Pseudonocardia sp.]|nr:DUF4262 domain-containing protein [Pseudonocardia sp.]